MLYDGDMSNQNLNVAKVKKNDEFYTQFHDIQQEINRYLEYDVNMFRNKTILLPCDDPEWSNFTKFFAQNFNVLGLKRLISTSYAIESKKIKLEWQPTLFETMSPQFNVGKTKVKGKIFILDKDNNSDGKIDIEDLQWKYMEGDGDFRSEEVRKLRDEADIIVTNPPFSLFREFLAWIFEKQKDFLIVGPLDAITYKDVFPLIKDNKMWLGCNFSKGGAYFKVLRDDLREYSNGFYDENTRLASFGNVRWFTNLEHGRRHEYLKLMTMSDNLKFNKRMKERGYQKYDNYNAIEVPFVNAIPSDYFEENIEKNCDKCLTNIDNGVTILDDTTRHDTTRHDTTRHDTTRSVVDSWEYQSHSSINTTQINLTSLDSIATSQTTHATDIGSLSTEEKLMPELSSNIKISCNGIMGVPISFLDKYNPDQFEIIGLANSARYLGSFPCFTIIDGRKIYNRLLIKYKK